MLRAPRGDADRRRRFLGWHQREREHTVRLSVGQQLRFVAVDEQLDRKCVLSTRASTRGVSVPRTRTPAATTTVVGAALVASARRESKLASTSTAAPTRGRSEPLTVTRIARMPSGTTPSRPVRWRGARLRCPT